MMARFAIVVSLVAFSFSGLTLAQGEKPATEAKPAAAPVAAVAKAETPKAEVKVPEAKPAVTAPEAKADASAVEPKPVKHAKHEKKAEPKAVVAAKAETPKSEPVKATDPTKK